MQEVTVKKEKEEADDGLMLLVQEEHAPVAGSPWSAVRRSRKWREVVREVPELQVRAENQQQRDTLLDRIEHLMVQGSPPRAYQVEALRMMESTPHGGILALPPGSGKSLVCIMCVLLRVGTRTSSRPLLTSVARAADSKREEPNAEEREEGIGSLEKRAYLACLKHSIPIREGAEGLFGFQASIELPYAGFRDVAVVRHRYAGTTLVLTALRVSCLLILPAVLVQQWLGEFATFCREDAVKISQVGKVRNCTSSTLQHLARTSDVVIITTETLSSIRTAEQKEAIRSIDWRLIVSDDSVAGKGTTIMTLLSTLVRDKCWIVSATPAKRQDATSVESVLKIATGVSLTDAGARWLDCLAPHCVHVLNAESLMELPPLRRETLIVPGEVEERRMVNDAALQIVANCLLTNESGAEYLGNPKWSSYCAKALQKNLSWMDRTGLYEGERAEICANVLVALAEEKLEDTPITDQQRVRLYELYNAARMPGFAKEELDSIRWKKFDTAFEAIREWIDDEKGKAIIFVSQKATLEALKIYAKRADVIEEFAFLKDCPIFERDSVLKRFVEEEKEPLCMICRVKKVGKGISITTASLIVFVDWVPEEADRIQAEKRIHRIGQTRPCSVITTVLAGSYEETLFRGERRLSVKQKLQSIHVLDTDSTPVAMPDIRMLLEEDRALELLIANVLFKTKGHSLPLAKLCEKVLGFKGSLEVEIDFLQRNGWAFYRKHLGSVKLSEYFVLMRERNLALFLDNENASAEPEAVGEVISMESDDAVIVAAIVVPIVECADDGVDAVDCVKQESTTDGVVRAKRGKVCFAEDAEVDVQVLPPAFVAVPVLAPVLAPPAPVARLSFPKKSRARKRSKVAEGPALASSWAECSVLNSPEQLQSEPQTPEPLVQKKEPVWEGVENDDGDGVVFDRGAFWTDAGDETLPCSVKFKREGEEDAGHEGRRLRPRTTILNPMYWESVNPTLY